MTAIDRGLRTGPIAISGLRVLRPDGQVERGDLQIGPQGVALAPAPSGIDGANLLALPGIVDLHGDAFERQLMPRPGVAFPAPTALLDTDRQMLANGITTAYHGVTLSWEPGLRSVAAARELIAALEAARPGLDCDTRIHLRFEVSNVDAVDEVIEWIERGRIDLLAFNEHNDHIGQHIARGDVGSYTGRTRLTAGAFVELFERVRSRRDEMPRVMVRLAEAALRRGLPIASHDDETPEDRARFRALGCAICEFPFDAATAQAAIAAGDAVLLGAPNILRGGSHAGRLGAREAILAGWCSALTSDYYYPSLLQAALALVAKGDVPLGTAWDLVSSGPALAAGLADRGTLEAGKRADVILVDDSDPALPRVAATFVDGRLRFAAGGFAESLRRAA